MADISNYDVLRGRKLVCYKGLVCVEYGGENIPLIHPEYGGQLIFVHEYDVNKQFHVTNGNWRGEIIYVDGIRKILVYDTGEIHEIDSTVYLWID